MLKVYGEHYVNDHNRRNVVYKFTDLAELEEWLFDQPEACYNMRFSVYKKGKNPAYSDLPFSINICLNKNRGVELWIHRIDNEEGIIFSDGVMTNGRKHWSKKVEDWCRHCDERWRKPTFIFID